MADQENLPKQQYHDLCLVQSFGYSKLRKFVVKILCNDAVAG